MNTSRLPSSASDSPPIAAIPLQEPSAADLSMLEQAVDRTPLIVHPDLPLLEAIEQMSQVQQRSCQITGLPDKETAWAMRQSSCALVVRDRQLVGILTERDVVQLAASGQELSNFTVADKMTSSIISRRLSESCDLFTILDVLRRHKIRHLPILDDCDRPIGVVTPESLRRTLKPIHLLKLRRIADAMTSEVIVALPTASVLHLAQLMADHRVSCIVIVEPPVRAAQDPSQTVFYPTPRPIGIVTERDILQLQALRLNFAMLSAQSVMSHPLLCLQSQDSLWTAHEQMQRHRLRRMVVTGETGELRGILTQTNLLRVLDPIEVYSLVDMLQQKLSLLETETNQLRDRHSHELRQTQIERQQMEAQLHQSETARQQSEAQLGEIMDSASAVVVRLRLFPDQTWKYDYYSGACQEISGYTAQELMADPHLWLSRVLPEDLETVMRPSMQQIPQAQTFKNRVEYRFRHRNGSIRWISGNITSRYDEAVGCWIVTIVDLDITDRKREGAARRESEARQQQAEAALQQFRQEFLIRLNCELEQRVYERTLQLEETNRQLLEEVVERKQAENQLRLSLSEKEVLLKEIHHRVKNNLQMISSLLSLQVSTIQNPDIREPFLESQRRIKTMALIHERLYQSKNFASLDFAEYVHMLLADVLYCAGSATDTIQLQLDIASLTLPVDTIVPCGLIINELVSNAIKHAFPDQSAGTIRVAFRSDAASYHLTIADDGVGIPDNIDFRQAATLGLQLVCALVERLQGTIYLDRTTGTVFAIGFPSLPDKGE